MSSYEVVIGHGLLEEKTLNGGKLSVIEMIVHCAFPISEGQLFKLSSTCKGKFNSNITISHHIICEKISICFKRKKIDKI